MERRCGISDLLLLLLYLTVAVVILFRVNVEQTGYLTPDSERYLELAQNLKDGGGFYLYSEATKEKTYFSVWPVGYPLLIYFTSAITYLNVFWASKVLNLLLLTLGFLLLRHINRKYSFILASVYCSYTLLEVYSFTWSEAPFLLGLLCLCYLTQKLLQQDTSSKYLLLLFLTCLFLFLMRYVGAFSFSVPALLSFLFYYRQQYKMAAKLAVIFFLLGAVAGGYLFINYKLSGFATGFDRLEAETESAGAFIAMMGEGLLNEILLIRKFRLGNQLDYLLYFTTLLQLAVMAVIVVKVRKKHKLFERLKINAFSIVCLLIAILYLFAVVVLRSFSHFDDLDYRLLSPFSFLFWVGIVHVLVSLPDDSKGVVKAKYATFAFFILSLLLNLPKLYILEKIVQLLP